VRDQYADIQQQLQAIMYTITKSGNNLNQIAHVLNAAKQQAEQEDDDLTDDDLWRWVAKQLVENSRVLAELQQEIINLKNDTGQAKLEAGGEVVSPGNSLVS
ncbi:MAG: plasmid mobilization relaxosome protein MobC, partial [Limosilactobacillus vaginalis]